MEPRKILVAVNLEASTQDPFSRLECFPIPKSAVIQLVHVVQESIVVTGLQLQAMVLPTEEDRVRLEAQIRTNLCHLRKVALADYPHVTEKIIYGTNTKVTFTDYAVSERADLLIVATRNRQGIKALFDSSFAQHQVRHSPVSVLVLR